MIKCLCNVHQEVSERSPMQWRCAGLRRRRPSYLAKLLNAADWGFMQRGTLLVFNCSAINLCISSVTNKNNRLIIEKKTSFMFYRHLSHVVPTSISFPNDRRILGGRSFRILTCIAAYRLRSCNSICTCTNGTSDGPRPNKGELRRLLQKYVCPEKEIQLLDAIGTQKIIVFLIYDDSEFEFF